VVMYMQVPYTSS